MTTSTDMSSATATCTIVPSRPGSRTVISLSGAVDDNSSQILRAAVAELLHQPKGLPRLVVLDVRDVSFMDSRGLSAVAQAAGRLADAGAVVSLRRPSPDLRRLLDLARAHGWLPSSLGYESGRDIPDQRNPDLQTYQLAESGSGSGRGYDALLSLASVIWKQRRRGLLPDPGEEFVVHHELPRANVVSVVEARGCVPAAALLRFPQGFPTPRDTCELALARQGWTRESSQPSPQTPAPSFTALVPRSA